MWVYQAHASMETFGVYQPRCFGLLISPGKDVKHSEMNLLDNMVRGTVKSNVYCYRMYDILHS